MANLQMANVQITNTGGPFSGRVTADLPQYGSPRTTMTTVAPGQTVNIPISPIVAFGPLFQNTTTIPAAINIGVSTGSATTLYAQSFPVQITGRNTVFWRRGSTSVAPLIATMVTPQDSALAVSALLTSAGQRVLFANASFVGYQGANAPTSTFTVAPGTYQSEGFVVLPGESISVAISSVSGGVSNNVTTFIASEAEFQLWAAGQPATACAINSATTAGTTLTCPTPPEGYYRIVYVNPNSNFSDRGVTRSRARTKWEVTYYQSRALFEELRARGLIYVNLTGTGFFGSSQNVRYPQESIGGGGANCIDGALLFASAWEAAGMKPQVFMSFTAGHAFAGVQCWSDTPNCYIAVETTLVGGSAPFSDAYVTGMSSLNAWSQGGHLINIDIAAARSVGLTPAPR
ncbi:MAG: hypothetical protein Q8L14_29370 [Myxococcales bacterium]|nr:hypothetical protein [Myxococcales bacterium]